jgi:type IV secretory pathway TraG/TraD family ATPase VirD4
LDTAQMVSAWLGQATVPAVSVTTRGRGERSTTVSPRVRPLLPAEDMTRLPDGALIALAGASRPMVLRQSRYFESEAFPVIAPPFPLHRREVPSLSEGAPGNSVSVRVRRSRTPPPRPAGGVGV